MEQPMNTLEDALRWALRRIQTSQLGEGEYFERAAELLKRADESREAADNKIRGQQ